MKITSTLDISEEEVDYVFMRSTGAGGQYVNTTDSAVQLRFDLLHSPSLSEDVRLRAMALAGHALTESGMIVLKSQRYRNQLRNKWDVREKFIAFLKKAACPPIPRKQTHPPKKSIRKRLEDKARIAVKKAGRRHPSEADER